MALDLLKKTRWLSLAALVGLASTSALGCAEDSGGTASSSDGSSTDDITQINHTKVKRQSIGNCWIYATTSWLESLNKDATGQEKNTSESWLTYWHWFEQLANGGWGSEISTGGSYGTAVDLISRYGIMLEKDFIAAEAESEMSNRQSAALAAMNESLKSGALSDPATRRDRTLLRRELNRAWALDARTVANLDRVFGAGVERTLDRAFISTQPGSNIIRARDFPARLKDPQTGQFVNRTLADAIGQSSGFWAPRQGKFAWNEVDYPGEPAERREFWKRVQRALHDQMPVITSWKVDFNALTTDSRFSKDQLDLRGPGRQGGHMTVMHDYQANVPGMGVLAAGVDATRAQMEAALSDGTVIEFVRVKNSWGGIRPDRWTVAAIAGYHDLEMGYLDGPIKECSEDASGNTDPQNCRYEMTPLWDVVLPAGY